MGQSFNYYYPRYSLIEKKPRRTSIDFTSETPTYFESIILKNYKELHNDSHLG